ncbi:MAG: hypothetical protein Q9P01_03750 [Anaerolineae bacterium]|nr:hypothetical protein [Anaerolineae bacterium]
MDSKGLLFLKAILEESLKVMVKAMPVSEGLLSRFTENGLAV